MNRGNKWTRDEIEARAGDVLDAAIAVGTQLVIVEDGYFTLTYVDQAEKVDAAKLLASGGVDESES